MGRLKNGLLLGGLLGAGVMWLNTTKKGRELRSEITSQAADIYGDVKERVMASETWSKLSKTNYLEIVKEAVDDYAKRHPLAEQAKGLIVKILSAQWSNFQSQIKKRETATKTTKTRRAPAAAIRRRRTVA